MIQPLQYDCTHLGLRLQGGLFVSSWLSHDCDRWLSLIRKVQESLSVFTRTRHEWEFWHQNVTETWSLDDMSNSKDVIAGPEYTRLQKISFLFFLFFLTHSNHYYVNSQLKKKKKKQVESQWRRKNRQKRQIAESERPFRCRTALWSDTKKRYAAKIMSHFRRNQIEDYKAVKNGIIPLA